MNAKMKTKIKSRIKQTGAAKQLRKGCPRCGSYRTYNSDEEFICMACSYIVVKS